MKKEAPRNEASYFSHGLPEGGFSVCADHVAAPEFLPGPLRRFAATQQFSRFRSEADIQRAALTEPDL
jgi:hypothetical protein